jgi:hypothetical protein
LALKFATLRSAIAVTGIAALAFVAVTPPVSAAEPAKKTKINTFDDWDGGSTISPWGNPNTTTYGQTITIPKGNKKITKFSFYMMAGSGTGTIRFTGDVYGWDGARATNEVFESKVQKIKLTQGDPTWHKVTVKTKGAKVEAGKQYVLFLSVDKTYEQTDPNVTSVWANCDTDALPGGNLVFQGGGGDESQWTTGNWGQIPDFDMVFWATLK